MNQEFYRQFEFTMMLDPQLAPGTYSIVAVDAARGDAGCAVQSRYFAVGPVCPWMRVGVGAVATQSNANVAYGPQGLALLAEGLHPEEALVRLTQADELREQRQAALINMAGESACWTGAEVNAWCGSRSGAGYSCQGNLLAGPEVVDRMAEAFEGSAGTELAERLMRALEAGEAAGGDLRGSQSAALIVARWDGAGAPPDVDRYNLRVDEHPQPVRELRRLYHLKLAYRAAFEAQSLAREGAGEPAAEKMAAALELAPEDDYLQALAGEVYFRLADRERAVAHFRQAVCLNPKARCYLTLFGNAELYDAEFRSAVERAAGPKASEEKSR